MATQTQTSYDTTTQAGLDNLTQQYPDRRVFLGDELNPASLLVRRLIAAEEEQVTARAHRLDAEDSGDDDMTGAHLAVEMAAMRDARDLRAEIDKHR